MRRIQRDDTVVSAEMLERAVKDILNRRKLDRTYDIPYLAGYSRDGKTIYIDRHLPESFTSGGRVILTDRFLILHETLEKSVIDTLGLVYQHAHQLALREEEAAVRAFGVSWKEYSEFMDRYIKEAADERLTRIPSNLDIKPYRDEHDFRLLKKMQEAMS